jgi:hypothetical protein
MCGKSSFFYIKFKCVYSEKQKIAKVCQGACLLYIGAKNAPYIVKHKVT